MKIILWIVAVVVVLVALGFGLAFVAVRKGAGAGQNGQAVRVEPAELGDLTETITAPGMIEAKSKVSISARISARIVDLPFKEGDTVTKGDDKANPPIPASTLVLLDATDAEAQLRQAEARYSGQQAQIHVAESSIASQTAQIDSCKSQLDDAQRTLQRDTQLLTTKDVSQADVDTAQAKVDQLRAALDAAKHSLEGLNQNLEVAKYTLEAAEADIARAKDNLSYTKILSPIDGVVTRVNSQIGELVVIGTMNNAGTVIAEVADLSKMILKARVDESSIAAVKVGQKAVVRLPAYQDKEFEGVVTTVALADTIDTQAGGQRYFKAEVLLDTKGQRIISGLNGDVDIDTNTYHDVVMVPSQAVLGRPVEQLPPGIRNAPEVDSTKTTATVVYRLINGKSVVTPVTVGSSDVTRTIIKSGLKANEPVIIGPFKVLETIAHDQAFHADSAATKPATKPSTKPTTEAATQPTTAPVAALTRSPSGRGPG